MNQVHKEELLEVPGAKEGKKSPKIQVYGMEGIPASSGDGGPDNMKRARGYEQQPPPPPHMYPGHAGYSTFQRPPPPQYAGAPPPRYMVPPNGPPMAPGAPRMPHMLNRGPPPPRP